MGQASANSTLLLIFCHGAQTILSSGVCHCQLLHECDEATLANLLKCTGLPHLLSGEHDYTVEPL